MKIRIWHQLATFFFPLVGLSLIVNIKIGSADPIRVAVVPFTINAEKKMDFLKNGIAEILESRISSLKNVETVALSKTTISKDASKSPMNGSLARNIGKEVHADYVIYGSLTVLGESASIDAKVVDTAGKGPPLSFFRQTKSINEVLPETGNLAKDIGDTVFAKAGDKAVIKPLDMEKEQKPLPVKEGQKDSVHSTTQHIPIRWKSEELDYRITGIGAGDLDGDGKTEMVVSSAHDLYIYRFNPDRFEKIGEFQGKNHHKYLAVDTLDVNQNGRAEIFVSCQNTASGSLDSFIVEWSQGSYSAIMEGESWYFRVIQTGKDSSLFGQRKGISEPFFPAITEFSWNGSSYVAGKKQSLPEEISIFGLAFADIAANDEKWMVAYDSRDKICVFNADGKQVWKSAEYYGGSEAYLTPVSESDEELEDRIFLSQRILVVGSGKGDPRVITVKNNSLSSRYLKRFRSFGNAGLVCFTWNGLGLSQRAKTDELAGYIPDFTIVDINQDGSDEMIGAIVMEPGSIISSPKSVLAAFDLSPILGDKK